MTFTIYALCEPDTTNVRYVGQTNNLRRRLANHMVNSRLKSNNHKTTWIKSLKSKGLKPQCFVIETTDDEEEGNELEIMWIAYYKAQGFDLTNYLPGGVINQRGKPGYWTGKKRIFSEEWKSHLGRPNNNHHGGHKHSQQTLELMSRQRKGRTWKLIDGKRVFSKIPKLDE